MAAPATHWVFGYGSLMWRPGFRFRHAEPALLTGFHRALCVFSYMYRGTADVPGLVFGLDEGGQCHGLAFEVEAALWPETISYLRERELIPSVYHERELAVTLEHSRRQVAATAYVVDRGHAQYTGPLSNERILRYVRQGHGEAGSCVDYVHNTARHLRELGLADPALDDLAQQI